MAQTIKLKRSSVSGNAPSTEDLALGEVAINTYDGKMYIKKDDGTESIVEITGGGGGASVTVSDSAPSDPGAGDLWWDSTDGTLNIYYEDANTSQWVEASNSSITSGSSGTVTSVAATVPTGFTVSGSPVTTSGTLAITFDTGYSLPTTASQTNWDTVYTAWGSKTAPSGTVVGTTDTQTLTNKTISQLLLNDGYTEEVFTITDGATVNLDPNNGSIQTWTLGASRTPGQANWAAGQSITLMIDDGTDYAITWTTLGVVWETDGGTAPTLATSGYTVIILWKVGSTIYGARVGDA